LKNISNSLNSHVSKTKKIQNLETKTQHIQDIFPSKNSLEIQKYLIHCEGNQEKALDLLLTGMTPEGNKIDHNLFDQTKKNLEFEESQLMKQLQLQKNLLEECGLEEPSNQNLEENNLDMVEIEKLQLEKRMNTFKSTKNV
jgi:hypothetical protein